MEDAWTSVLEGAAHHEAPSATPQVGAAASLPISPETPTTSAATVVSAPTSGAAQVPNSSSWSSFPLSEESPQKVWEKIQNKSSPDNWHPSGRLQTELKVAVTGVEDQRSKAFEEAVPLKLHHALQSPSFDFSGILFDARVRQMAGETESVYMISGGFLIPDRWHWSFWLDGIAGMVARLRLKLDFPPWNRKKFVRFQAVYNCEKGRGPWPYRCPRVKIFSGDRTSDSCFISSHPLLDSQGKPQLDILGSCWSPALTLRTILVCLQSSLAFPEEFLPPPPVELPAQTARGDGTEGPGGPVATSEDECAEVRERLEQWKRRLELDRKPYGGVDLRKQTARADAVWILTVARAHVELRRRGGSSTGGE
eukprot:Cvel_30968.t1-p1 / transcript=Cvel_30968.t1 / gene=Cvel_30968 / organism=Chromera_velia_CCMP2878 / gene_product=hypothetical protein / transcript_product=hypothetical protein / location=Cvel_scaffold4517:7313-8408(+) / protein_length=365 / sequence_SO=supercontig / SO=protein_coding / is_pseudo=false